MRGLHQSVIMQNASLYSKYVNEEKVRKATKAYLCRVQHRKLTPSIVFNRSLKTISIFGTINITQSIQHDINHTIQ